MTITYFLLYRFASSGYNIAGISSKQLPTNSCYMNISELIDTSFNKNVNNGWTEIVNDYNNIINNDIKYCSIDGENVTLSSLISIYMLIFNCKIKMKTNIYNYLLSLTTINPLSITIAIIDYHSLLFFYVDHHLSL